MIGGGPAGLSAALLLGRSRRQVLLVDAGRQRNRRSASMHGYLTRDGIAPSGFLDLARRELRAYPSIELRQVQAVEADQAGDGFSLRLSDGSVAFGRTLLVATGVVDDVPVIDGIESLYGRSVHHCPYCDGWEHLDEPIAVYGCGEHVAKYALGLTTWSRDIVLCTDGPHHFPAELLGQLERHGIVVHTGKVVRLEGTDGRLERIVFDEGEPLERSALFFCTAQRQGSGFAAHFGARFTPHGAVKTGTAESTAIPGLYVAGDASKDAQLVIVAAAEGAEAAIAINTELTKRDLAAAR
ncbi:MAG TPA: NAD(P)/FAD-dependent oxidoreductase [Gemmatimonadales bacterium]|nr:NAD(P)/FAD-dependent oxidoreductase [Gemmatimonadales bacterium]